MLSIVQLSRFLSFFSSDSFDILSKVFFVLSRTFYFSFLSLLALFRSASSDSLYRLSSAGAVNNFFKLFLMFFPCPIPGQVFPIISALPVTLSRSFAPRTFRLLASPAERQIPGSFKFPSSATECLSYHCWKELSMFSCFYLFQTIQYFLTILKVQNMALPIIVFIHTLNACRTEKNTAGSSPKRSICYNRN